MSGQLNSKYSASIRERFLASKTVADVTALMEEFTNAVEAGKHEAQGWPSAAYAVSKSGMVFPLPSFHKAPPAHPWFTFKLRAKPN